MSSSSVCCSGVVRILILSSCSPSFWRFFAVEPFGTPLLDVIQAQTRALLANINRNDKVRGSPFEAGEFLLFSRSEAEANPEPETVNGLTVPEWRLALYLRACAERTQE